MDALGSGTRFKPILDDSEADPAKVERVICLTGKLYYDLIKERQKRRVDNVAFIRVEELAPFPFKDLLDTLSKYENAKQVVWLQEEPRNQGAWNHVESRINAVLERSDLEVGRVVYAGRQQDSVPAPGIASIYAAQQKAVLEAAFRD